MRLGDGIPLVGPSSTIPLALFFPLPLCALILTVPRVAAANMAARNLDILVSSPGLNEQDTFIAGISYRLIIAST